MASIRLFEQASHARVYSKYRPTYPRAVLKIISGYIDRNGGGCELAVDIACGSGQSTFYLKDCFQRCIGIDISAAQIDEAQKRSKLENYENVHFMVGNGYKMPLDTGSVDAVTIAQAWHWMTDDVSKLYSECKRVLKSKGCLVVYGYGNVQVLDDSCNSVVRKFYSETLKGYWHKERWHIDNEYAEVDLPFRNTERHNIAMSKTSLLSDFIGYVSSWSGYQNYCEKNPKNRVLENLEESLKLLLSSTSEKTEDISLEIKFPVFMILGQN